MDPENKEIFTIPPSSRISKDSFTYQEKGDWCGVACTLMLLNDSGIRSTQERIAKEVYRSNEGTDEPELKNFLSNIFTEVNAKENSSLPEVGDLIEKGYRTIVYWWNDLPTESGEEDVVGHYSVLADIDINNQKVLLFDPSRQKRLDGKNGIYWLTFEEFETRWIVNDGEDQSNNWVLWVKPIEKNQKVINETSFNFQKPGTGWCGIASIRMLLNDIGINLSQERLAEHLYDSSWGTHRSDMERYLRGYFKNVNSMENCSLETVAAKLNQGYKIIVDWFDDLATNEEDEPDGHYSVLADIDWKEKKVKLFDPSNAYRVNGKKGIYWMDFNDFEKRWHDQGENNEKVYRWALFAKPNN